MKVSYVEHSKPYRSFPLRLSTSQRHMAMSVAKAVKANLSTISSISIAVAERLSRLSGIFQESRPEPVWLTERWGNNAGLDLPLEEAFAGKDRRRRLFDPCLARVGLLGSGKVIDVSARRPG